MEKYVAACSGLLEVHEKKTSVIPPARKDHHTDNLLLHFVPRSLLRIRAACGHADREDDEECGRIEMTRWRQPQKEV